MLVKYVRNGILLRYVIRAAIRFYVNPQYSLEKFARLCEIRKMFSTFSSFLHVSLASSATYTSQLTITLNTYSYSNL